MAATLLGVNYLMSQAQFRSPAFRKVVSGEADPLIRDGKLDKRLMRRFRITQDEIDATLRAKGIGAIEKVRFEYLEDDGEISALLYRDPGGSEQTRSWMRTARRSSSPEEKCGVGEI